MKATLTSTNRIVDVSDPQGRKAAARVWEGETEGGVKFTAYITLVQVLAGQGREAEFNRDLVKSGAPSAETIEAIDLRYVL
jgi:hypothetical protein